MVGAPRTCDAKWIEHPRAKRGRVVRGVGAMKAYALERRPPIKSRAIMTTPATTSSAGTT